MPVLIEPLKDNKYIFMYHLPAIALSHRGMAFEIL